jgi:hypothetical protein
MNGAVPACVLELARRDCDQTFDGHKFVLALATEETGYIASKCEMAIDL